MVIDDTGLEDWLIIAGVPVVASKFHDRLDADAEFHAALNKFVGGIGTAVRAEHDAEAERRALREAAAQRKVDEVARLHRMWLSDPG